MSTRSRAKPWFENPARYKDACIAYDGLKHMYSTKLSHFPILGTAESAKLAQEAIEAAKIPDEDGYELRVGYKPVESLVPNMKPWFEAMYRLRDNRIPRAYFKFGNPNREAKS